MKIQRLQFHQRGEVAGKELWPAADSEMQQGGNLCQRGNISNCALVERHLVQSRQPDQRGDVHQRRTEFTGEVVEDISPVVVDRGLVDHLWLGVVEPGQFGEDLPLQRGLFVVLHIHFPFMLQKSSVKQKIRFIKLYQPKYSM